MLVADVANERDLFQVQSRLGSAHREPSLGELGEEPAVQVRGFLGVSGYDGAVIQVVPDEVAQGRLAMVAAGPVIYLTADVLYHCLEYGRRVDPTHRQPHVLTEAVGRGLERKLVPRPFGYFDLVKGLEEVAMAPHSRSVRASVGYTLDLTHKVVGHVGGLALVVD